MNYEPQPPFVQAVPMGEGFIDYRGFFRALEEGGFDGSVAYEMCSPLLGGASMENLDRCAARFLEYMSDITPIGAAVEDRPLVARTRFAD